MCFGAKIISQGISLTLKVKVTGLLRLLDLLLQHTQSDATFKHAIKGATRYR